MLQAVLFDLDGTLLDTEPDFTLILNQLLTSHARTPVAGESVRKFISAGASMVVQQGFALESDDPQLPALLSEFLSLYATQIAATQAGLYADIDLVLSALHDKNLPWGIMTNKTRRFSAPLIARFESFATCATLVCPDDAGAGKPDPAGLLLACRQMHVAPAACLYVGDHPRDMQAARAAGMPAIAAGWGYLPDDNPLDTWGADFVAHTARDLLNHLALQEY